MKMTVAFNYSSLTFTLEINLTNENWLPNNYGISKWTSARKNSSYLALNNIRVTIWNSKWSK